MVKSLRRPRERPARHAAAADDVYRITGARRGQSDDLNARFVKYTVSMSVRMACILLAFVVPWPYRWFFIVGAIVLPYIAVVLANAGREPAPPPPPTLTFGEPRSALRSRDDDPA